MGGGYMIKFAVCDDEPFMLEEIASKILQYMEEHNFECQIFRFLNGRELIKSVQNFDVLFLDIQMEKPDGMETAKQLRESGFYGLLIFITVLKERVFDSFEVEAYDYLVKPLDEKYFKRTMERMLHSLEQKNKKSIIVQKGNNCKIIPLSQILYCEVLGRKMYLHQTDKEIIAYYEKMEILEKQVDSRFYRCHRSYLVNLDYVKGCNSGMVILVDGDKIPVSRLREQGLLQALLCHMKERRH